MSPFVACSDVRSVALPVSVWLPPGQQTEQQFDFADLIVAVVVAAVVVLLVAGVGSSVNIATFYCIHNVDMSTFSAYHNHIRIDVKCI